MGEVILALIKHDKAKCKNCRVMAIHSNCSMFGVCDHYWWSSMRSPGCSLPHLGIQSTFDEVSFVERRHCITYKKTGLLILRLMLRAVRWSSDGDCAKKQHAWLMTLLCHHVVSDLYLFLRGWQTHANTQTPTKNDTHCAFCLSHPLGAKQKSIHRGHCLRAAVYEKDLWKHQGTSVIHAPAAGV